MSILVINGSPRAEGNTATLLKAVADEASAGSSNSETTWYQLNDLRFKGCQSCFGCRCPEASGCILIDQLTPVLEAMNTADRILIGSPIYMGHVSGQLKSFWDRLFGFMGPDPKNHLKPGRKAIVALTQGMEDPQAYRPVADRLASFLSKSGLETRVLIAPGLRGVSEGDSVLSESLLAEAREAASWLSRD